MPNDQDPKPKTQSMTNDQISMTKTASARVPFGGRLHLGVRRANREDASGYRGRSSESRPLGFGHWLLVIDWVLGLGHWSFLPPRVLVIGHLFSAPARSNAINFSTRALAVSNAARLYASKSTVPSRLTCPTTSFKASVRKVWAVVVNGVIVRGGICPANDKYNWSISCPP